MNIRVIAAGLSCLVGALSLGQEILWVRLFSYASDSSPQSLGLVLSVFLLGVVFGSIHGKQLCEFHVSSKRDLLKASSRILIVSGVIDISAPFILSKMDNIIIPPLMLLFVFLTAATKASHRAW